MQFFQLHSPRDTTFTPTKNIQHSSILHFQFQARNYIQGIWVDGMDVLAVKNATAFAKDYALKNGPIVMEMVRRLRGYMCIWPCKGLG